MIIWSSSWIKELAIIILAIIYHSNNGEIAFAFFSFFLLVFYLKNIQIDISSPKNPFIVIYAAFNSYIGSSFSLSLFFFYLLLLYCAQQLRCMQNLKGKNNNNKW